MTGIKKDECVGCGACSSICIKRCIKMRYDFEGFKYPFYDNDQCVNCGMCQNVCPVRYKKEKATNKNTMDSDIIMYALAGYSKSNEMQMESTSGGIFPLLALAVLAKGGSVYGAAFNEDFEVVHIGVKDRENLKKLQKSKYVQSDTGDIFQEVKKLLENDNWVLFSGTPCQISALKTFLGSDNDHLLCVGVICHGVSAPMIWKRYLKVFHKDKRIEKINFRDKKYGWKDLVFSVTYDDGSEYLCPSSEEPFFSGFLKNLFLRRSCYNCKFKANKTECDIMLGDAWGVDSYAGEVENKKGTSLVLIHNQKGAEWMKEIENNLRYEKILIGQAIRYNPRLIKSVEWNKNRIHFYDDLKKMSFKLCMKKYLKK